MPDSSTPDEDGENAASVETAKPLSKKKKILLVLGIGAVAVVAVGGLLIKLAQKNYATEDVETDESLDARVPTPAELEFAAIVRAAAESVGKIMNVSTSGFTVEAKIRSNSGRGMWTAYFQFDEETGHCHYSHPYRGATAPLFFIEEVQRRLSEAAAA
ncbi:MULTISPECIES: hypothetical protein [Streptomyces]|uniref:hypothetical protein n=1 Tax=Streptomyces TaxID=1883 RepID=UPI0029BC2500|nr:MULTISPECIES: hypothetical protein [unclassified Streptomyces]MDX3605178.1 hypothetical protein [Streptomyces sp. FL06-04B]MDX3736872.1 hypothetical protein [Streptomyces sp. ID01-15D]